MSSCDGLAILILALFFTILFNTVQSSPCSDAFFVMTKEKNITQHCKKLTTLGAELAWNVSARVNRKNDSRLDIFFGARLHAGAGWLAWGVNPNDRPQMVGSRAIIGIKEPNGSSVINTYNITGDTKLGCELLPSGIDVGVQNMKVEYWDLNHYFTISATLLLPSVYSISSLNHVWQVGYNADGETPKMHPATLQNVDSTDTLDLNSGKSHGVGKHRHHLRMVHGILNIVGWGTFMPVGVIIARYFRKFPIRYKHWYFLHVSCQIVGYILGTTGWVIGLWLGHASTHYSFRTHRILAIIIFAFTSLQMLALRLRPKPNDEYRKYWDMYHHFLGYALIAVIITNIFRGVSILRPSNHSWKWAYFGVLVILVSITLGFEVFTWIKFVKEKGKENDKNKSKQTEGSEGKQNQGPTQGPEGNTAQPKPPQGA